MSNYPLGGMPPTLRPDRSSCLLRLMIMLFVVGAIGFALWTYLPQDSLPFELPFISRSESSTQATRIPGPGGSISDEQVVQQAAPLELRPDAPLLTNDVNGDEMDDVLVHAWDEGHTSQQLALISGMDGSLIWRIPEPDDLQYFAALDNVVVGVKDDRMRAINLADGKTLWSATLIDKLITYPQPQVWQIGDVLIAHTVDNTLTAYNPSDGAQLYQRTLTATNPDRMVRMTNLLCDTERVESDHSEVVRCYTAELGDGPVLTLGIDWTESAIWWPDPTATDGSGFRFVSDASPPRLEYVNLANETLWQQNIDQHFSTIIPDSTLVTLGPQRAALAEGDTLTILTASQAHLINVPETDQNPLMFEGDTLYVLEVRERGSRKMSMVGYDVNSGQQLWRTENLGVDQASRWSDAEGSWGRQAKGGLLLANYDDDTDVETVMRFASDGTQSWTINHSAFIADLPEVTMVGNRALLNFSEVVMMVEADSGAVHWMFVRP